MGLYDYIGHDGDQVKCFDVPCIHIDRDINPPKVNFYTSGGRLANVNKAPYMTHYYNYGKDFAIVDDGVRGIRDEILVHIVRDGNWVESKYVEDFDDNYNWPPVTINKYGMYYNVHSIQELRQMIEENEKVDKEYECLVAEALDQVKLSRYPNFYQLRETPAEMAIAEMQIRNDIESEVFKVTYTPFNQKWLDNSHESPLEIIGFVIEDYLDEQREDRKHWRNTHRPTEDWYIIFSEAVNQLKEQFENPVESYLEWCDKEGIIVDKNQVRELFKKYTNK